MATLSNEQHVAKLLEIEQLIARKETQKAAAELNAAVRAAPGDPRVFLLGSKLAEATGHAAGMLESARRAVALAPQWPVALIHLASVLALRLEASEARHVAQQAVRLAPDNVDLLARAIAIARKIRDYASSVEWSRMANRLAPDQLDYIFYIARDSASLGKYDDAVEGYNRLLERAPGNAAGLLGRATALVSAGRSEEALGDLDILLKLDPANETLKFYQALARGETPPTQPDSIIANLFDEYADHFDRHLVLGLKYKTPRLVADMLLQWHPDKKFSLLDLGCGTGLLGACLGKLEGQMVGCDLAPQMLEQARKHEVYDRLEATNLLDTLRASAAGSFDAVAACDVLIYVGKLDEVVSEAHRVLKPQGHLVFTCEASKDGADYVLLPSLRYAHGEAYVRKICAAAGFKDLDVQPHVVRQNLGEPVDSFLVIAQR